MAHGDALDQRSNSGASIRQEMMMKKFFEKYGHLLGLSDTDLRAKLAEMDDAALAEFKADLKTFAAAVKADAAAGTDADAETTSALRGGVIVKHFADELATQRKAEVEAATADTLADLEAALADDEAEGDEADDEEQGENEAEGEAEGEGEAGAEGEGSGDAAALPIRTRPRVPAAALAGTEAPRNQIVADEPTSPSWKATNRVGSSALAQGVEPGDEFENRMHLASVLAERFRTIGNSEEQFPVAKMFGTFDEDHTLTKDLEDNGRKLGLDITDQALVAAICAPAEPYYNIATMSSTARPVRGSLSTFAAPRGGVTVYPSPRLSDVGVSGRGIWTRADDAAGTKVKNCTVIPCSSPTQYDIYGIYRCMTITNMMAMTYPELVDAFMNRLEALWASLAESTLLTAMSGSANTRNLNADLAVWGYSARQSLLDTFIETLVAYREQERYDEGQRFDAWAPRWLRWKLATDLVNRKNVSGGIENTVAALADVEAAIRDVGLDMTWTIDYAAGWTATPVLPADSSSVPAMPTTGNVIMAPKGNFRVLDRGDLTIGVTNNNIYRDNSSNAKNVFTMFFENFEGLIDMGATNVELTISNIHASGAQVADATIATR